MPVLSNPRWERFAQELAQGKSANEAYVEAGYKENRHNAAALARSQHISTRLQELQERGAAKVEITQARLLEMLEEDRDLARSLKQTSAAVAASTAIGKLFGLFVEKTEKVTVLKDISDQPMTDEEWAEKHSTAQ